ncbi:MAG: DUF192 domain-containing protein [Planctomycetota bacterium]
MKPTIFVFCALCLGLSACAGSATAEPKTNSAESRPGIAAKRQSPSPDLGRSAVLVPDGKERLWIGEQAILVEVAAVPDARALGLGGRAALLTDEGMIFVYHRAEFRSFWMKDCKMSLDIAYLGTDRKIFQIGSLDPPVAGSSSIPRLASDREAQFVIEMEKGWFERKGHKPGVQVRFSKGLMDWLSLVLESEGG